MLEVYCIWLSWDLYEAIYVWFQMFYLLWKGLQFKSSYLYLMGFCPNQKNKVLLYVKVSNETEVSLKPKLQWKIFKFLRKKKLVDYSIIQIYITVDRTNLRCFEFSYALWFLLSVLGKVNALCFLLSYQRLSFLKITYRYRESEMFGGSK